MRLGGEAVREGWAQISVKQICNIGSFDANLFDRLRFYLFLLRQHGPRFRSEIISYAEIDQSKEAQRANIFQTYSVLGPLHENLTRSGFLDPDLNTQLGQS